MQRRELLLGALAFIPASRIARGWQNAPAQAQQQTEPQSQPAPTFSTDVKVVNVFATVRDKDGHIVTDLNKEDFTLVEDGRPQTIRYFTRQTNLPLTIGLLVDTSGSERRMLPTERDASYTFLEQVLRPEKDKGFLIHFDREVELLQDVTSSRERLEKALDLLNTPQFANNGNNSPGNGGGGNGGGNGGGWPGGGGGGGGGWPGGGGYGRGGGRRGGGGYGHGGGGTTLYDAIYLASDQIMSPLSGRKALILLTDGEDNASKVSLAECISSANRASTMAYGVRIADQEASGFNPGFGGGGMGRRGGGRGGNTERPDGKKILKQIAAETGGSYFEVSKKKTVSDIYSEIEEELRNQYSIGYTSDNTTDESNFRKIALTVDKKGLTVQARDGYYPHPSKVS